MREKYEKHCLTGTKGFRAHRWANTEYYGTKIWSVRLLRNGIYKNCSVFI